MKNLLTVPAAVSAQSAAPVSAGNVGQFHTEPCRRIVAQPCPGAHRGVTAVLAVAAFLSLFAVAGCISQGTPAQRDIGNTGTGSIKMTRSALVRELSVEQLTKEASIVVVGTVREVSAGRWSTLDGKRPPGPLRGGPDMPIIFREAILEADEYVKGAAGAKELTIHLFGGQVGGDNMEGEDEVSLEPREKVLVFLGPTADPVLRGRAGYRVVGSIQGKYKITDGVAVGARPSDTVPMKDLIVRIKSALTN